MTQSLSQFPVWAWLLGLAVVCIVVFVAMRGRQAGQASRQRSEALAQRADAEHEGAQTRHEGGA